MVKVTAYGNMGGMKYVWKNKDGYFYIKETGFGLKKNYITKFKKYATPKILNFSFHPYSGIKTQGRTESRWTLRFHRVYPDLKKFNTDAIAQRTGISRSTLQAAYKRGLKERNAKWAESKVHQLVLIKQKKVPKSWTTI
jgi:hypothetical protein